MSFMKSAGVRWYDIAFSYGYEYLKILIITMLINDIGWFYYNIYKVN